MEEWDNLSNDEEVKTGADDSTTCRDECERDEKCVQWRHIPGRCKIGHVIRLGERVAIGESSRSGWMEHRIDAFQRELQLCEEDWIA